MKTAGSSELQELVRTLVRESREQKRVTSQRLWLPGYNAIVKIEVQTLDPHRGALLVADEPPVDTSTLMRRRAAAEEREG